MADNFKRSPLKEDCIRKLLALNHSDITAEWMKNNFAVIDDKPAPMSFTDTFTLTVADADKLPIPKIKSDIETTAGRFIANYFMLGEAEYTKFMEYINEPWDKKVIGKIGKILCRKLVEEKISSSSMVDYINRSQWFGFTFNSWINPSIDRRFLRSNPDVNRALDADIAEHQELVDKADIDTCIGITSRAEKMYKEALSDDPSIDWLKSGASKNVLGVMSVARGLSAESRDPNKLHFVRSSLQDGITKEELPDFADMGIGGACSRGVETQKGGYVVKIFNASFAHVRLDSPGTDCHTKYTTEIVIDNKTLDMYHLRYVISDGKEYCLDEDTIKQLMGKKVKLRTPLFCIGDCICNKCAGEFYYKMGIRNVGFLAAKVGSSMLKASLKGFHEATIKASPIDLDKYITKL